MSDTLMDNKGATIRLLLVEDDDGDAKAVRRAFKKAEITNPIDRVENGIEALEILRGENGHPVPTVPYILMVDLNMPRMDGIELVQVLRKDPKLRKTVVFILTTSKREEDKAQAYDLNVAGYIVKENAGRDFMRLVQLVDNYWKIVEMP